LIDNQKKRTKIQEPKKHQIARNKKASTEEAESRKYILKKPQRQMLKGGKNSFKVGEKRCYPEGLSIARNMGWSRFS